MSSGPAPWTGSRRAVAAETAGCDGASLDLAQEVLECPGGRLGIALKQAVRTLDVHHTRPRRKSREYCRRMAGDEPVTRGSQIKTGHASTARQSADVDAG
jgi:hypothetical protein